MPTPHLIHVGYAKTGSTVLQRWFGTHPQIAYAEAGIAGFRSVWDIVSAAAGLNNETRLRVTSCEALSSPRPVEPGLAINYEQLAKLDVESFPESACHTLKQLFPDAFILIVTRGFASMILSSYSEYVRSSGEMSFVQFVRNAAARNPWKYDQLIASYRVRFGERNVIVLPYEMLRDDRAAFAAAIEQRFALDHHPLPARAINPSLTAPELIWYPRMNRTLGRVRLGRMRRPVTRRYVSALNHGRLRWAARLLQTVRTQSPLGPELLDEGMLRPFAGGADSLVADPSYGAYISDYLISPTAG